MNMATGKIDNLLSGNLGMFFPMTLGTGASINIPQNTDLNSAAMLKPGRYSCPTNAVAETIINTPTQTAFQMLVFNMTSEETGEMPSGRWSSRTRILMTYNRLIYLSQVTRASNGNYSYGSWNQVLYESDTGEISCTLGSGVTGSLIVRRIGHAVQYDCQVAITAGMTANANMTLGTVPVGYRPERNISIPAGDRNRWGSMRIWTSGTITFYNANVALSAGGTVYAHASYFIP